jgi:hypothetical protein
VNDERKALAHRIAGKLYLPTVHAINATMDDLQLTYTAHQPIQGEGSNKVMAYEVTVAAVLALIEMGVDFSAVSS